MPDTHYLCSERWRCCMLPGFGANVISLRHNDHPILREPWDFDSLRHSPVLYGIPLLFPPNRTAGGRFTFDGKEYQLPVNERKYGNHLHGLLYNASFEVLSYGKSHLKSRLVNDGGLFPFHFELSMTDTLHSTGFERSVQIKNTDVVPMPLTLGFHATFTEPDWFSVPIGRRWVTDPCYIPTGELIEDPKSHIIRTRCIPHGHSISGFFEADGDTAQIGSYIFRAEGFDQWILYNDDGMHGFLCVEPQQGPVNSLATGRCKRLLPGESAEYRLYIGCNI